MHYRLELLTFTYINYVKTFTDVHMLLIYVLFFLQVQIVKVLHRTKRIPEDEIAVLTPYSSQKDVILNEISKEGLSEITIQTVTESQGVSVTIIYST